MIAGGDLVSTLNHVTELGADSEASEVLLVCGSFYIMDDVRRYFFRRSFEADPATVNAN